MNSVSSRLLAALFLLSCPLATVAQAVECPAQYDRLKHVYFGDLHTHTSYSLDAIVYGTATVPSDAYLFARGGAVNIADRADIGGNEVPGPVGYTFASNDRWLDFNAVTDHSEWLSNAYGCAFDSGSPFYSQDYCTKLTDTDPLTPLPQEVDQPCESENDATGTGCLQQQTNAWNEEKKAADDANDPCTFTAFEAYEWTKEGPNSMLGSKESFHKNVIFKGSVAPALPFTALTHTTSESLWSALSAQCNAGNGCDAITIPHSLNQSNGQAFTISGYSAVDLNRRMKYQRLVEIHQHKGNSECMSDAWDNGAGVLACDLELDPEYSLPQDEPGYARPGMTLGLARFAVHGDNPVKVGFVGATDNHNSTPGNVAEESWIGNLAALDNTPEARLRNDDRRTDNPGGITGVWAEENTRDSIFAALKRRETFATSGPKISVRFYQVHGIADPCADANFPEQIVAAGGVPMGGTMSRRQAAPKFVVYATPDQVALDQIDFVKVSISGGGAVETVHPESLPASAPNPPGCVVWEDTQFQQDDPAFYYVRVRQQPTWRWSHYDCEAIKQLYPNDDMIEPFDGDSDPDWMRIADGCGFDNSVPRGLDFHIQERAWTSAIWYLPGGPVTIPIRSLAMRDGTGTANPDRHVFKFVSKTRGSADDHRIVVPDEGSDGDPTAAGGSGGGAELTIYNPDSGETLTASLDAASWSSLGPGAGYEYRSKTGPVFKVKLRPDSLSVIAGGGAAFDFTLDEDSQGAVAVRLKFGAADPWCAVADARTSAPVPPAPAVTTLFDRPGRFTSAKNLPPPDQCPLIPGT